MSVNDEEVSFFMSGRSIIALLLFVGFTLANGAAFSTLNFTIVCMAVNNETNENSTIVMANGSAYYNSRDHNELFQWDKSTQASLLAANTIGSATIGFVAGMLIHYIGAKKVLCVTGFLCGAALLLSPVAAKQHWGLLLFTRFISGVGGAPYWPATFSTAVLWTVKSETGMCIAFTSAGYYLGAMICHLISGQMCATIGWEYVYYLFGSLVLVYVAALSIIFTDDPKNCKWLSPKEVAHITKNRKLQKRREDEKNHPVPWRYLLTSPPVITIILSFMVHRFAVYFLAQFAPTYFRDVLAVDVRSNGIFSALPMLTQVIGRCLAGILSEWSCMSRTLSVKLYTTIGFFGSAMLLISCTFVPAYYVAATVVIFNAYYALLSVLVAGYLRSTADVAPSYCSIVSSLSTQLGFLFAATLPFIVGALTKTPQGWTHVFYLVAGVMISANVLFLCFGSGSVQKWDPQHRIYERQQGSTKTGDDV